MHKLYSNEHLNYQDTEVGDGVLHTFLGLALARKKLSPMKRFLTFIVLLVVAISPIQAQARQVFAHYHLPYGPHGHTIEGYKRDIRDARNAGLDGFMLNFGEWSGEGGHYRDKVAMMFRAAEQIGPTFKL